MNNTRKTKIIAIILLVLFSLASTFLPVKKAMETAPLTIHTQQGEQNFTVEIARTAAQQEQGLMYRNTLAENEGMIFLLSPPRDMSMWMKNTLIPLDMLFIDEAGKIIYIARNISPHSETTINAGVPVSAVLELAGGVAEKNRIKVGDQVVINP